MEKTYFSRVDAWLVGLLVGVPLVLLGYGAVLSASEPGAGIVMVMAALAVGFLTLASALPCVYILSDESLRIRSGMLINVEVPLHEIREVRRSRTLWAGPALSLRRVKVITESGAFWVISPRERDEFLADITERMKRPPADPVGPYHGYSSSSGSPLTRR